MVSAIFRSMRDAIGQTATEIVSTTADVFVQAAETAASAATTAETIVPGAPTPGQVSSGGAFALSILTFFVGALLQRTTGINPIPAPPG